MILAGILLLEALMMLCFVFWPVPTFLFVCFVAIVIAAFSTSGKGSGGIGRWN